MLKNEELISKLEELNTTLGALNDTIKSADGDCTMRMTLDDLEDSAMVLSAHLKSINGDHGVVERLIRMNRELSVQLDNIIALANTGPVLLPDFDDDDDG